MEKLYDLITWHNNTTPAINEDNLNAMSEALDGVDTRIVELAGTVLDVVPLVERAEAAASSAIEDELEAEAWAVGTRDGVPVSSTDPAYHNNAKYWAAQSDPTALANMSDVDISSPSNEDVLKYNSQTGKWENGAGSGNPSASNVSYDNTDSELEATNVQDAVDEVVEDVNGIIDDRTKENNIKRISISNTSGWSYYSTTSSGDFYRKYIELNHIYATPEISIAQTNPSGLNNGLPSSDEQIGFNALCYVTFDESGPGIYLYASKVPDWPFYINVKGVD